MPAPLPVEKRNNVIREYLLDGSAQRVAARNGITGACIRQWQKKPWFEETRSQLQAEIAQEVKYSAAGLIRKAQERAHERLDTGDAIVLKDGLTVFYPVSALDCARIGTLWLDRLRVLEGQPTKITANIGLQQVLHQFQALAEQYQSTSAVQEGTVIHSLSTTPTEDK